MSYISGSGLERTQSTAGNKHSGIDTRVEPLQIPLAAEPNKHLSTAAHQNRFWKRCSGQQVGQNPSNRAGISLDLKVLEMVEPTAGIVYESLKRKIPSRSSFEQEGFKSDILCPWMKPDNQTKLRIQRPLAHPQVMSAQKTDIKSRKRSDDSSTARDAATEDNSRSKLNIAECENFQAEDDACIDLAGIEDWLQSRDDSAAFKYNKNFSFQPEMVGSPTRLLVEKNQLEVGPHVPLKTPRFGIAEPDIGCGFQAWALNFQGVQVIEEIANPNVNSRSKIQVAIQPPKRMISLTMKARMVGQNQVKWSTKICI